MTQDIMHINKPVLFVVSKTYSVTHLVKNSVVHTYVSNTTLTKLLFHTSPKHRLILTAVIQTVLRLGY